ncbi:MAG TPA: MFS transporter, partial [Methanocorpusculum sp.]|nr:MFS transporter [Methanocorpusculum sp.]
VRIRTSGAPPWASSTSVLPPPPAPSAVLWTWASAAETGFILLFQPLVQAIATPAVGKFSGKVDAKYLTTAGMIMTIIGLLLLSGLGLSMTNVALYIIIAQVFTAFGVSLFSAPNTTTIMSSVKPEEYSMASSLVSVFRMAGMLLSMAVCMTVISVIVGSTALLGPAVYAEFTAALRISMLISVALSFVGLFFSWFRGPAPNQQ